jgi:hypothetical protein
MSTWGPEAEPSEEEASAGAAEGLAGAGERIGRKRKGGSAVVWTPARAATRRQLVVTKSWCDVRCRARQVQVRGREVGMGSNQMEAGRHAKE